MTAKHTNGNGSGLRLPGAKATRPTTTKPAPAPAKRGLKVSDQAFGRALAILGRNKPQRSLRPHNPFEVDLNKLHPPGAIPKDSPKLAMDSSIAMWAGQAYGEIALNSAFVEGQEFLGYPYLAVLAQRAEYRAIVETLATESMRKGYKLEVEEGSDEEETDEEGAAREDKQHKIKLLNEHLDNEWKLREHLKACSCLDGYFGRGHLYIDTGDTNNREELGTSIGDGRNQESRLKIARDTRISLRTIEPVWCYPQDYNASNPLKPDWFRPQRWTCMGDLVHVTRLLPFVSHHVSDLLKPAYSFGGLSMVQMAKPYVDNWLRNRQSASDILNAYSVMVLLTDMSATLEAEGEEMFRRAAVFNAGRQNNGLFMADKENEDMKNVSAPLGTVDQLVAQSQEHMSLPAGALIETARGTVPIEAVTIDDLVLTRAGFAPIKWVGITGTSDAFVEIETAGSILRATGNHPIWSVSTNAFVNAENVSLADRLLAVSPPSQANMVSPSRGAAVGGGEPRADITATRKLAACFIASCGKRIEALSQMALRFIMRMMTVPTTLGTTLSFSPDPSMVSGTAISARIGSPTNTFARIAEMVIRRSSNAIGKFAGHVEVVPIRRVSAIKVPRQPTYDIEVAEGWPPEFFAEGLLVHNCAVSKIPSVKLLGLQPAGLNADSEGVLRAFDDTVHSYQEPFYRPHLTTLVHMAQLVLFGAIDPSIKVTFPRLREMDEKERAEINKIEAETDIILIEGNVLHPEESRKRVAGNPDAPYQDIDVDDVPEPPPMPGEEGGEPGGGQLEPPKIKSSINVAGGDSAGPTMEMTEAGYIDGPVKREPCQSCSMYRGSNRCSLVIGDIAPRGHCAHWKDGDRELLELLEAADRL